MKLCKCVHHSECPAASVQSDTTLQLCQNDPKFREVFMRKKKGQTTGSRSRNAQGEKPGSVLARNIEWISGIKGTTGCSCKSIQKQMDREGCDWCEKNEDALVARIMVNAEKLVPLLGSNIPILSKAGRAAAELAVRQLLKGAIATAREEATTKGKTRRRPTRAERNVARGNARYPFLERSPTVPTGPLPFRGEPQLNLLFHVWPNGDAWRSHIDKLQPNIHRFKRKILGIAYDSTTKPVDEVKEAFGPGWEYVVVPNGGSTRKNRGLREVATYQKMVPMLDAGHDDVTFCLHGKGSQAGYDRSDPIQWWINAMYDTVYYNIEEVLHHMSEGKSIVGSFRKMSRDLGTRFRWHFSGTFYAFRNVVAASNGWPEFRQRWWGTESWPGDHFPVPASHCIFGDHCGNLYEVSEQPRAELEEWRKRK